MPYPYQQNTYAPFPNNSAEYTGTYPTASTWSASKSPYYSIGDFVEYKGLIYRLNYNWDGTTVGSPGSQVDANGVRVWTLWPGSDENILTQNQQMDMGYWYQIGSGASSYKRINYEPTIKRYWNQWHNITSAHSTVFEYLPYKLDTESGGGRNLLNLALTFEPSPLKNPSSGAEGNFQSVHFDNSNGIDNGMFGFITTSCGLSTSFMGYASPYGIFDRYSGFPYNLDYSNIGTLIYSKAISYTLTEKNWVLHPEYDPTATTPFTYNYTIPGVGTRSGTKQLFMTFAAETFLGRTYTGALRVYDDANPDYERYELDSVSPDLRTP